MAPILARGVAAPLTVAATPAGPGRVRLRQPIPPDLALDPREADGRLDATLTPLRRGRHTLGAVATRAEGPLRLGRWHHQDGEAHEVLVYPDLPAARRLALSVRQGRFREQGRLRAGRSGSAPTSSRSATTRPTTTCGRSTGARPTGLGGR